MNIIDDIESIHPPIKSVNDINFCKEPKYLILPNGKIIKFSEKK
jgi:hypothetical protein